MLYSILFCLILLIVLFDIIDRHSLDAQKSQLVTLKWRDIVFFGLATALWALLCLSETLPDTPCVLPG